MTPATVRIVLIASTTLLAACAGAPAQDANTPATASINDASLDAQARARADAARVRELNQQLAAVGADPSAQNPNQDYRLGPGDLIKIQAPQVPEIDGLQARLSGPGSISVPLLGELKLGGLTLPQAQERVNQRLAQFVHTPQTSLFITEYASQEITVTGAVANPGVYPIRRPRSLVEVLTMVGGLSPEAGSTISVRTNARDLQGGAEGAQQLIVDLHDLVDNPNAQSLLLKGGDSVYVPEAGVFFVAGAVDRPGSYPLRPGLTVLKGLAIAGDPNWEAVTNNVRVIRHDDGGVPRELTVDLAAVRDRGAPDMPLEDGDVIVVDTNTLKKGAVVAWDQTLRVLSLGVLYR
jgi:polysaccharide export outer membrane protein